MTADIHRALPPSPGTVLFYPPCTFTGHCVSRCHLDLQQLSSTLSSALSCYLHSKKIPFLHILHLSQEEKLQLIKKHGNMLGVSSCAKLDSKHIWNSCCVVAGKERVVYSMFKNVSNLNRIKRVCSHGNFHIHFLKNYNISEDLWHDAASMSHCVGLCYVLKAWMIWCDLAWCYGYSKKFQEKLQF